MGTERDCTVMEFRLNVRIRAPELSEGISLLQGPVNKEVCYEHAETAECKPSISPSGH